MSIQQQNDDESSSATQNTGVAVLVNKSGMEWSYVDDPSCNNVDWDQTLLIEYLARDLENFHIVTRKEWSDNNQLLLVYLEGAREPVKIPIAKLLHAIKYFQLIFSETYGGADVTAEWLNENVAKVARKSVLISTDHGMEEVKLRGFALSLCGNPFKLIKISFWPNPTVTKPLTITLSLFAISILRDGARFSIQTNEEGSAAFMQALRKFALQVRNNFTQRESKSKDTHSPKQQKKKDKKRKSPENVAPALVPASEPKRRKTNDNKKSSSSTQEHPNSPNSSSTDEMVSLEMPTVDWDPVQINRNSGFNMMMNTTYYDMLHYSSLASGGGVEELPSHADWLAALAPELNFYPVRAT